MPRHRPVVMDTAIKASREKKRDAYGSPRNQLIIHREEGSIPSSRARLTMARRVAGFAGFRPSTLCQSGARIGGVGAPARLSAVKPRMLVINFETVNLCFWDVAVTMKLPSEKTHHQR